MVVIDKILGDVLDHKHPVTDITGIPDLSNVQEKTEKSQPNGYASLGADGKVPTSELNPIAITSTFVVNSQAAQLALTTQEGDVAVRTDLSKTYIHNGGTAGTMADWTELATPTDSVLSVNSKTGAVTLTTADIADSSDKRYLTDAQQTALHSHTNKALLDTYDQTNANLTDAVSKKHTHANQTALDAVTGTNTGDQTLSGLGGLALDGSTVGATTQAQAFTFPITMPAFDFTLTNTTDGEYFNNNTSTTPVTWTEVDAANNSNTNGRLGFWTITGTPTEISWKYRKRIAAITEGSFMSFQWGVMFRDGQYPDDLTYTFGMYADNGSGTIDETKYTRMELFWSAVTRLWNVRHVVTNGTTTSTSTYYSLSSPLVMPIYLRTSIRTTVDSGKRGYFGTTPFANTQTLINNTAVAITWNTPWVQMTMNRAATGVNDLLYVGSVDRNSEA